MPESGSERRLEPRVPFALEVAIKGHRGITFGKCQALDTQGIAFETDYPYDLGEELLVKFVLPGDGEAILGEAKVVEQRRTPRPELWWLGLRFTRLATEARVRIASFVGQQAAPPGRDSRPEAARRTPPAATSTATALPALRQVTQQNLRKAATARLIREEKPGVAGAEQFQSQDILSFLVRFSNAQEFFNEYAENISKGGIFIKTDLEAETGKAVLVRLLLPESTSFLYLSGRVVWRRGGARPGLGIQFVAMEEDVRRKLEAYVEKILRTRPLTLQMWKMR